MDDIEIRVGRRIRDSMLGEVRESLLARTPGEAQAVLDWMKGCDDPGFLVALTEGKYVDGFLPA